MRAPSGPRVSSAALIEQNTWLPSTRERDDRVGEARGVLVASPAVELHEGVARRPADVGERLRPRRILVVAALGERGQQGRQNGPRREGFHGPSATENVVPADHLPRSLAPTGAGLERGPRWEAVPAMSKTAPDDLRKTLDRFLVALYDEQRRTGYEARVGLDTLATSLSVTPSLTEKIAQYLEREGLLELDQELVDLTVEGILRAESIARDAARSE